MNYCLVSTVGTKPGSISCTHTSHSQEIIQPRLSVEIYTTCFYRLYLLKKLNRILSQLQTHSSRRVRPGSWQAGLSQCAVLLGDSSILIQNIPSVSGQDSRRQVELGSRPCTVQKKARRMYRLSRESADASEEVRILAQQKGLVQNCFAIKPFLSRGGWGLIKIQQQGGI